MRLLCETVVKDVLPAVRSLVATELQEKGYTQTEIAELLDLTQPAVSQYLNAARGTKVERIRDDPESYGKVQDFIDLLTDDAADDELSRAFCDACVTIRENGLFDESVEGSEDLDSLCSLQD